MKQKIIAVIDSGVGGLSILAPLKVRMPYNDFLYFSDGENLPYGNKSQAEIRNIAKNVVEKIISRFEVDIFVLACNTLTAGAIDYLRETFPTKIFIGCEPNLTSPKNDGKTNILVLCTSFTKDSQRINSRFGNKAVFLSAPLLANKIEREATDEDIKKYLMKILPLSQSQKFDSIVLGCTHYFLKKNLIEELYGLPTYTSVEGVVNRVHEKAQQNNAICIAGSPIICFWETGNFHSKSTILQFLKKI